MINKKFLWAASFFVALSSTVQAEPILVDSFESGDMSATNEDGFAWDKNNRTSVVSRENLVYSNGYYDVPIPSGRDWSTKEGLGDYHLRLYYNVGEPMTEQRFNLGRHYKDIWISYWLRVPVNFEHGSLNNKFLSVWPERYDRSGTVTWQTRPNGAGGANLVYQDGGVTSKELGSAPFISVPEDQGRWMHVIARIKSATGPDANDGIIQFYRRWENDNKYQLIHENRTADTWDDESDEQGISQGYILGWANDPYDETTEWFLDEFTIHTTSPMESFANDLSDSNRPNPPKLDIVN